MTDSKERQFVQAKQRLDDLRITATFPIECTDLVSRLLSLISPSSHQGGKKEEPHYHTVDLETRIKAVTMELQRTVKENNTLHLESIHLKEENELLQKRVLLLEGIRLHPGEQAELSKMRRSSEKELQRRLGRVTQKHNELLARVYGEEQGLENLEKAYVAKGQEQEFNQALPPRKNMMLKEERRHEEAENSPHRANIAEDKREQDLLETIQSLKGKIKAREGEISRLHHKMGYDGLNINKMIKDFHDREASSQVETLNHQVDLLNKENFRLKDELKKVRLHSGRAEVLRVENEKLRARLDSEKKQASENRTTLDKNEEKSRATLVKVRNQLGEKHVEKMEVDKTVERLQKENHELAKVVKRGEKELGAQVGTNEELADRVQSLEEQIETLKNAQEGEKIFLGYELEDYKKKQDETESAGRSYAVKIQELSSRLNQLVEANRLSEQEIALKDQSIGNLEAIVREQKQRIAKFSQRASELESPLQRQLEYTSSHLHEVSEEKKHLETDLSKLRVENEVLRKRLDEADEQAERAEETEHRQVASEIGKLLKINQELRNELQKSNSNVESVQSSLVEVDRLKHEMRRQSQALALSGAKVEALQLENDDLTKNLISGEDRMFKLKEENKKFRAEFALLSEKADFLEEEHALLTEFKRVNLPKILRLQQNVLSLANEIKQSNVTHTLISQQNNNLKRDIYELEATNRNLRLINSESRQDFALRAELNSLLSQHQTLMMVNNNLKQAFSLTKCENEEMKLDRENLLKEIKHLRLQIRELQQLSVRWRQNQDIIRNSSRDEPQQERSGNKSSMKSRREVQVVEGIAEKVEKASKNSIEGSPQ